MRILNKKSLIELNDKYSDVYNFLVKNDLSSLNLGRHYISDKCFLNLMEYETKYDVVNDEDTIDAFFELSRLEGIIPAIESAHAVAYGIKLAKKMGKGSVLICLSGRGDKDMDYIIENYGIPDNKWLK